MPYSYRSGFTAVADGSGSTVAGSSVVVAGDLGWLAVEWLDPAGTIDVSTLVDGSGHLWQAHPTGKVRNATQQYSARLYYVPTGVKASASNTITATLSAPTTFKRLHTVYAKSSNGALTFDPVDGAGSSATGSGTTMAPGNITPTAVNDLAVGVFAHGSGNVAGSSPYTLRQPAAGGMSTGVVDRALSGGLGVAVNPTANSGSTSGQWLAIGALFKDVPAASPTVAAAARSRTTPGVATSTGKAQILGVGGDEIGDEDLYPSPFAADTMFPIVADYWWGGGQFPVSIPYAWIAGPLTWVEDPPLNVVAIAGEPGYTATDPASVDEYGQSRFSTTLSSATAADAALLGQWVLAYYGFGPNEVPRVRFLSMRFVLNFRAADEIRTLLGLAQGQRITITGTPATWPAGATNQIVEGVQHSADDIGGRFVELATSPVIGTVPGTPGPWFRLGSSVLGGTDVVLF